MRTRTLALARAASRAVLLAVLLGAACGPPYGKESKPPEPDLLQRLRALASVVSVTEMPAEPRFLGRRFFMLEIEQPADHRHPSAGAFRQRATLFWRGADRPTVLLLSGYAIDTRQFLSEPTALLDANQVYVEHRFFESSRPDPLDWKLLDVFQAAADHHGLVAALKPLLPRPWVNTGGSKGGMAAVFHRFQYPDDVAGTIAYVAPISYGTSDERYVAFLDQVGDATCRDALRSFQVALFDRESEVMPLVADEFASVGETYAVLGLDTLYEFSAVEAPYTFWQYSGATCAEVPAPGAPASDLLEFLDRVLSPLTFGDSNVARFEPYFYQSATELGGPGYAIDHLAPHVVLPFRDVPAYYPPAGVEKVFDAALMPAVQDWVTAQGTRLLFLYGANDPWSSGAFEVNPAREQLRFFVAGGDHLTTLSQLPDADYAAAVAALRAWAGLPAQALAARPARLRPGVDFEHVIERRPVRR